MKELVQRAAQYLLAMIGGGAIITLVSTTAAPWPRIWFAGLAGVVLVALAGLWAWLDVRAASNLADSDYCE
jgi:hypothetical protein